MVVSSDTFLLLVFRKSSCDLVVHADFDEADAFLGVMGGRSEDSFLRDWD